MKKKSCSGILGLGFLITGAISSAGASTLTTQTWLPGECIPQFTTKLPIFGPGPNADLPRVDAHKHRAITVKMKETTRQVLPTTGTYTNHFDTGNNCPTVNMQPTKVWGYETSDTITGKILGPAFWPAVTVETRRNIPTQVTYVNELPNGPDSLLQLLTVDKTIHWADPYSAPSMMNPCMDNPGGTDRGGKPCKDAYTGPVPTVPHLHGAEVPSQFDGGPEAWFTPDGRKGRAYSTIDNPGNGKAIYLYNNTQEPGTPWFHDHALGVTRINVYSGLAAFYLIRDPSSEPKKLPDGPYEIEMAIQDRQFDTNSQLFFPDGSGDPASNLNGPPPNPDVHPFWIPEFIGDVVVVNGTPWPFREVEPRRYRFRILDGSNARFFNLTFGDEELDNLENPVPVYAIGADVAYLDKPAPLESVLVGPGERVDLIVDFTNFAGKTITVTNDARVPFPDGPAVPLPANDPNILEGDIPQPQMANIMQFKVKQRPNGKDKSCNPAAGECTRRDPLVRLTDGKGHIARDVKVKKVRQLILKEHVGFDTSTTPPTETGPLDVLLNNTRWHGLKSPSIAAIFPQDGVSELPQVGSVELWEIINLTADAHPIHTHLSQFQILNREEFNTDEIEGYPAAWAEAFGSPLPKTCDGIDPLNPCPGYGPPLPYFTGKTKNLPNGQRNVTVVGGNPLVDPFLTGKKSLPSPEETGWKETARILPGQVMRILVRWAPTSTPVNAAMPGKNLYPFDPTTGPGYAWHCHILDHEDNEMMRPYKVTK